MKLLELKRPEELAKLLKADCAPFLKEAKGAGYLYRGMRKKPDNLSYAKILANGGQTLEDEEPVTNDDELHIEIYDKQVRNNRDPKDTTVRVHNELNAWFKKNFGYNARSETVFCTGSNVAASEYGDVYYIFPIGEIKYIWSKSVDDLYHTINPSQNIEKFLETAEYQDADLPRAIKSNNEIMIACKSYYCFPYYPRYNREILDSLF